MDPSDLDRAAELLVRSVLELQPDERLLVICDEGTRGAGDAILGAGELAGAFAKLVVLDRTAGPLRFLPEAISQSLSACDASVFVALSLPREISARQQILHKVRELGIRHAHMPGIDESAFIRGVSMDYQRVAAAGAALLARIEEKRVLEATSDSGTSLRVALAHDARWHAQLGTIRRGKWGNLPAGALYASPEWVSGTFVADACVGEFFGEREGVLLEKPVAFTIESGRVTRVEGPELLAADIRAMLQFGTNSDRVGLVCLGVNEGIGAPTGRAIIDQNRPGMHIVIGNPAARSTGARWSAPTCFGACQARGSVAAGRAMIVERGRLQLTPAAPLST